MKTKSKEGKAKKGRPIGFARPPQKQAPVPRETDVVGRSHSDHVNNVTPITGGTL